MAEDANAKDLRVTFGGGVVLSGAQGLDLMSVSCRMSSPAVDQFRARVRTTSFGDVMVTRTRARQLVAQRTVDLLDDFYSDHLQIGFRVQGQTHTDQQRRSFTASLDQVAVLYPGDTFTSVITDTAEVVQFYLPVHHLRDLGVSARDIGGRSWGPSPLVAATRQFLLALTADSPSPFRSSPPEFIARALTEMALGMLHELRDERLALEDARDATRVRVRAHIASHAHDPELSVERVAAHVGTSRRYLQALFEGDGAGVGALIRTTRLEHAAQRLVGRPRIAVSRVAAATGFRGPDQLSRAFQAIYGLTPTDYRKAFDAGLLSSQFEQRSS